MLKRLLRFLPLFILLSPAPSFADPENLLSEGPYHFVCISPDGKNVAAYMNGEKNSRIIFIIDTLKLKADRISVSDGKGGQGEVSNLQWVDNEHLVILSNGEKGDNWLHTFKLNDKFPERIGKEGKRAFVRTIPGTSRFLVTEQLTQGDSQACRLLEYDLQNPSEPKEVFACVSKTFECVADYHGTLKALKRDDGDGSNAAWYFVDSKTGTQTKLSSIQQWNKIHGIVQSSNKAIVSGQIKTALPSLYVFDLENDSVVQVLADQPLYSIDNYGSTVFDPNNGKVVGLHLDSVERRSFWTDAELNKLQSQVDTELAGSSNRIQGWSNDRKNLLVERYIPNFPTQFFHVDVASNKFSTILLNGPKFKLTEVGPTRLIDIPNRDGVNMAACLTIPAEKPAGKFPLLVWLRKGVWTGLDRPEWNPEANFFAAEGFAVLRLNYSGSQGLLGPLASDTKSKAGIQRTFNDIEDAIAALVQAGLVDPEKICIGGQGVAAWAAAYAPIAQPGRYKAVACLNGVYDLVEYREASKGNNEMNGGLNFDFANSDSPLSDEEVLSLSVPQNLSNYPKDVFVAYGKWNPQPYKNHVLDFIKALKKERINAQVHTSDWWGSDFGGIKRVEAFSSTASSLKSAVK